MSNPNEHPRLFKITGCDPKYAEIIAEELHKKMIESGEYDELAQKVKDTADRFFEDILFGATEVND